MPNHRLFPTPQYTVQPTMMDPVTLSLTMTLHVTPGPFERLGPGDPEVAYDATEYRVQ